MTCSPGRLAGVLLATVSAFDACGISMPRPPSMPSRTVYLSRETGGAGRHRATQKKGAPRDPARHASKLRSALVLAETLGGLEQFVAQLVLPLDIALGFLGNVRRRHVEEAVLDAAISLPTPPPPTRNISEHVRMEAAFFVADWRHGPLLILRVHDAEAHDLRVEELIRVRRVAEDRRDANPCAGLESRHRPTSPYFSRIIFSRLGLTTRNASVR